VTARSSAPTKSPRTIVVAGDVSVDWLLPSSAGERRAPVDFIWMWGGAYSCRAISSRGGAAAHARILRAVAEASGLAHITVVGPEVPPEALASPYHASCSCTYALIQRVPRELGVEGSAVWRIADFLGSDPAPRGEPAIAPVPQPGRIDTLLLVDHAQGYRDRPDGLSALLAAGPGHIVWQTGAPHTGSALADVLLGEHKDHLTVITASDELRKAGHQVGYALSWEQVTEEIRAAVAADALADARRVIVVIGAVGALIVERDGADVLVFDSRSQEGDWAKRFPGVGAAYGRCIDAAVTLGLADEGDPAVIGAVKRGLAGARAAHLSGFVVDFGRDVKAEPFPIAAVAEVLSRDSDEFASVVYRPAAGGSILAQTYSELALTDVAAETAVGGPASLPPGIPVESVGSWTSVDRAEIESLRSVRNIMQEYVEQRLRPDRGRQPLSIAVFGPPGAGKTYAVRQLATALLPDRPRALEFNLSQLRADSDLHGALHRVRDVALEGDLPLVFWDEFDAPLKGESLGWLQHFLAPMEDGRFRDDAGFHPVGPAIFVFAGGTAARFEDFVTYHDERAERAAKKPDFISRLGGYVDVNGPNPQGGTDVAWPLRRALLLRSLVAHRAPQMMAPSPDGPLLQIDEGVLRAFLLIGEYIHGARSMAAIVRMSALSGKPRFERASLPARQQLGLHVDADQFLRLVRG
jgi:hypothetical protein